MTFTKLVISSVKWIAQLKHIYECEHAKNEWLSPLGPEAIATMRERNKNKFPCSGDESTQWSHLHISFHTFCTQRAHNNAWVSNENVIRKRYSRLFIASLYFSCSIMHSIRAIIAHAIHALKHFISSHLIANNFQATISQMPWWNIRHANSNAEITHRAHTVCRTNWKQTTFALIW